MAEELLELIVAVKERLIFMRELGVDGISVELSDGLLSQIEPETNPKDQSARLSSADIVKQQLPPAKPPTRPSRLDGLPSLTRRNAAVSQVQETNDQSQERGPRPLEENVLFEVAPKLCETNETIGSIRADIGDCTRCKLHSLGRRQIVHTTGNFSADLMFIGEAPGADEDEQGFPFVGRAGQLLTDIIAAIGFRREEVCIGNINRCRPPGNRQPEPDETAACRPFILREIAVIKPKVIVVLGATAAHNLLEIKTPISKLRGNFQDYFGVKVMPTFHPAYLLRDPNKKKEVWEDMKMVRDLLRKM